VTYFNKRKPRTNLISRDFYKAQVLSEASNQHSNPSQLNLQVVATSANSARLAKLSAWLKNSVPETIEHSILPVEQFGYESGKSGKAARTAEFNAGRFCAQQALSAWNQDGLVGQADDRSPNWPDGFSGSISHSKNWVWASVAKSEQVLSIGVDTEVIVDSATRSQTWEQVATIAELRTLETLDLDPATEFTVLFSAKEAFYKCWYPVSKQYFDFKDATVESCQPGQLTIRPTKSNPISQLQPSQLTVQYLVDAQDVFTVIWMTEISGKA